MDIYERVMVLLSDYHEQLTALQQGAPLNFQMLIDSNDIRIDETKYFLFEGTLDLSLVAP